MSIPQIVVELGLVADSPTQSTTALFLNDPVKGLLGTGTLGTAIIWTDISSWVNTFSVNRSFTRLQGPLWNFQGGTCTFVLDNSDGRFDPDNLAGPYVSGGVTQLAAMVPIRIRVLYGSTSYGVYSGFTDGWNPAEVVYAGDYTEITVNASDAFKVLAGMNLPTTSIEGVNVDTGARVKDILSRASWYTSAERTKINTGNSLLQGTTLGSDPLSLMQIAADSEIGQLYVDNTGAVVFRSRHAILTDTRSNTVQGVFGDAPGTVHPAGTEVSYSSVLRASDDTTIVNDIQATRLGGTLQEVTDAASIAKYLFPRTYARSDLILLADSDALAWAQWVLYIGKTGENRFESIKINPLADPVNLWPQVLMRDVGDRVQVWRRPPGVVDMAPWSLTNNSGSAPANNFTVPTSSVSQIAVSDFFQIYTSGGTLKDNTTFEVVSIGPDISGNTAVTFFPAAQLTLAVGDVVVQTGGALSKDCFIMGITHDWNSADSTWVTSWTFQDATKYGNFMVLDNTTLGKLGSSALVF